MRNTFFFCCSLALLVLLQLESISAEESREKIKVGMLLTLSAGFATAGEDCKKGIEAALTDSKSENLFELLYADSRNNSPTAVSEFKKLVQSDGALAIYTHRSSMGMALNPVSKTAKIPLIGAVGHKGFAVGNEYAFQIWPRSDEEGSEVAREFIRRGYKQAALIFTDDEWTGAVSDGFRREFEKLGGALVFDQSVLLSETDFRTLLIKAKGKTPSAYYMNMLLPQIGPIIKQARQLDVRGQYYSNFYVTRSDVREAAGDVALEGVRYVAINTDLPQLKAKLGVSKKASLQGLTVASYVGTSLLAQAAENIDGEANSAKLYSALLRQKQVETPDHIYPIIERRVQFPLVVREISGAEIRVLDR